MKHARHSPNTKARIHAIPPWPGYGRAGHQRAVCGTIPLTDPERWGNGRWFWTEEPVSCKRCLEMLAARQLAELAQEC
jgi:hypothetical protein